MDLRKIFKSLSENLSSIKLFFETYLELVSEMWKYYRWLTPFVAVFIFFASVAYFVYKKFSD